MQWAFSGFLVGHTGGMGTVVSGWDLHRGTWTSEGWVVVDSVDSPD
jgi:hypothetical protein